ncbi:MAG: hypothetical protein ACR2OP_04930, partial [Amylibacter sp.]
ISLLIFILCTPSKVFSAIIQENIILKNAFSENIENYEPKLRPVNLSAKKITLINNSDENYIIPPTKPKNFDALVKQAKISELMNSNISFNESSSQNIDKVDLFLENDNQKFNFINRFDTDLYTLISTFGSIEQKCALFRKNNGIYQSAKIDQEIDGWKILEINPKSIKVKKGNQSETIKILN